MSLSIAAPDSSTNYAVSVSKATLSIANEKEAATTGPSVRVELSSEGQAASKENSASAPKTSTETEGTEEVAVDSLSSTQDLSQLSESQLKKLVEDGTITQQQANAELANRKLDPKDDTSSQVDYKVATAIETYKNQTEILNIIK